MLNKKRGFTLVELLLTLSLVAIVIALTTNFLTFSMKGQSMAMTEFDIQSNTRFVSQKINTVVRDSAGVFILHRENDDNLTEEWNYIMLNDDKTKLLEYVWNGTKKVHEVRELMSGNEDTEIDIEFIKDSAPDEDKLMKFILDVSLKGKGRRIETELEAKNSLQVVDRSYTNRGNVIAFRNDKRLDDTSNAQAVVSMILDKSGSMAERMDGGYAIDWISDPKWHSRMKKMKKEANRLLDKLSEQTNINLSLVPFSDRGTPTIVYNVKKDIVQLKAEVNGISARGATNTGDGIRRGFYNIKNFNDNNTEKTNKNFMIILVDGVSTKYSTEFDSFRHDKTYENFLVQADDYGVKSIVDSQTGKKYVYTGLGPRGKKRYEYTYVDFLLEGNNRADYVYGHGGQREDLGSEYIRQLGEKILEYKKGTNEEIKVYVIGFSAVAADHEDLRSIALSTTGDTEFYEAGDEEALEEIFKSIQRDITDALWHIGGPN